MYDSEITKITLQAMANFTSNSYFMSFQQSVASKIHQFYVKNNNYNLKLKLVSFHVFIFVHRRMNAVK